MSILLFAALITSSPYPFEVGSGFVVEPTLGYVFNDKIDREKLLGGVRLSYLRPDPTDALIAPELSISSANEQIGRRLNSRLNAASASDTKSIRIINFVKG